MNSCFTPNATGLLKQSTTILTEIWIWIWQIVDPGPDPKKLSDKKIISTSKKKIQTSLDNIIRL